MNSFEQLTPDAMLGAVEKAISMRLTGLTQALPSYINRVYELRAVDGTKLVAKFYRPGRWSRDAIADEHRFVLDCYESEIPVVPPMTLVDGTTVGDFDSIAFAVFPKRAGRTVETDSDSDWVRIGSLLGRIHLAGQRGSAPSRITLDPRESTTRDIEYLCGGVIPERLRATYRSVATQIVDVSAPLFEGRERIRVHGDFHRGNVLDRLDEGLMVIDFDDMANGPAVQDLWMLLPEHAPRSTRELSLVLDGYERFRSFDRMSLKCIEPLRAMRMIYFAAWVSRQVDDYQFRRNFPEWGSDPYWQREINDLREQAGFVFDAAEPA